MLWKEDRMKAETAWGFGNKELSDFESAISIGWLVGGHVTRALINVQCNSQPVLRTACICHKIPQINLRMLLPPTFPYRWGKLFSYGLSSMVKATQLKCWSRKLNPDPSDSMACASVFRSPSVTPSQQNKEERTSPEGGIVEKVGVLCMFTLLRIRGCPALLFLLLIRKQPRGISNLTPGHTTGCVDLNQGPRSDVTVAHL